MTLSINRPSAGALTIDTEPPPSQPEAGNTVDAFAAGPVRLELTFSPDPAPPPVELQAARRSAEAANTWARLLRERPSLQSAVPQALTTPAARLLYVISHRSLASGMGPLTVPIGPGDAVRLLANGSLSLTSAGRPTIHLHNQHDDLARLLDGAQAWNDLDGTTLEVLLGGAVKRYYADESFDGGGAAPNERGRPAFTYATIQQVLVSGDSSQRGLECLASAAVHLWKSAGLVPPGLTREEFEHRYTSIHGDRGPTVRLGPEFDRTLRGGRSMVRLDAVATTAFANLLRMDDWGKLTGAASGNYQLRALRGIDELVSHFGAGGPAVRTSWADGGHYFVLSGARLEQGEVFVNEDDSLRGVPARRTSEGQEPYRRPYDANGHTRFWTLERT